MSVFSLVEKYGKIVERNGEKTVAYLETTQSPLFFKEKQNEKLVGVKWKKAIFGDGSGVDVDDVFKVGEETYKIYKTVSVRELGGRVYSEAVIYLDLFTAKMDVYNQKLRANFPKKEDVPKIKGVMCAIETWGQYDRTQIGMSGVDKISHVLTIEAKGVDLDIDISDRLIWVDEDDNPLASFEVIKREELDEKGTFLRVSTKQVKVEDIPDKVPENDDLSWNEVGSA